MGMNLSISAKPKLAGSLAALASVLIWSGWIVFTRHGVTTDVPAVTLGLLRYAIPTLVTLPLLLRSMAAYRKAGWLKCAIMVCGSGAPFFLICSLGMTFAPAAHVGVMLPGVMPMFVALFAFVLFGERLNASVKQAQEAAESSSKTWPRQSPAPASSKLAPPKASTPARTIP